MMLVMYKQIAKLEEKLISTAGENKISSKDSVLSQVED